MSKKQQFTGTVTGKINLLTYYVNSMENLVYILCQSVLQFIYIVCKYLHTILPCK